MVVGSRSQRSCVWKYRGVQGEPDGKSHCCEAPPGCGSCVLEHCTEQQESLRRAAGDMARSARQEPYAKRRVPALRRQEMLRCAAQAPCVGRQHTVANGKS